VALVRAQGGRSSGLGPVVACFGSSKRDVGWQGRMMVHTPAAASVRHLGRQAVRVERHLGRSCWLGLMELTDVAEASSVALRSGGL
jgi:hypothetical protein